MECCWHNLGLVAVKLCFKCCMTTIMHINSLSRLMRLCKLIVEKIRNFYFKHLCTLKVLCRFTENVNFNFVTANKKCIILRYVKLTCSASYNWSSWNCKKWHMYMCVGQSVMRVHVVIGKDIVLQVGPTGRRRNTSIDHEF